IPKFIDNFLEDSQGIDIWRSTSQSPGFTYKSDSGTSFSRLDYFIMSHEMMKMSQNLKMRIANWISKQDHSRISLKCALPHTHSEVGPKGNPWSVRQPCLFKLNDLNRQPCKMAVNGPLQELLDWYITDKKYSPSLEHSID